MKLNIMRRLFVFAFLFFVLSPSASWARKKSLEPQGEVTKTPECRLGQVDYGSGLVKHELPETVQSQVVALSHCLQAHNETDFLSRESIDPSAPHISLMYGAQPKDSGRLQRVLNTLDLTKSSFPLVFGSVTYWDDDVRNKTTLAMLVADNENRLLLLHQALRGSTDPERYPYHPHVTIGHLRHRARLSFAACQSQLRALSAATWHACDFAITDHCGQPVWQRSCR